MDRIYRYNLNVSYEPNGGRYLQIISAKDLYIQIITEAEHDDGHSDSFKIRFPNVFTNYPLGAVRVEDQRFKDWDHYKFTLWQSQLNFIIFCASSACGVSVGHLNAKEPMIKSIYRFHVYYHIRRILKILEIPLPYDNSFNQYNNPYSHEKFIGICSEYGVSNDLTKWRNQKYFSTWQSGAWETGKSGMSYINENSFSRWIIERSNGLTTLVLQKLSKSVRDYAYLILTSYTGSKVDYVISEFIYILPSDMNLRIGRVQGYNNKILVSRNGFKIGTNLKINLDGEKDKPDVKSNEDHKQDVKSNLKSNKEHKPITDSNREHKPNIESDKEHKQDVKMIRTEPDTNKITYEEEKVVLVLGITSIFTVWWMFK